MPLLDLKHASVLAQIQPLDAGQFIERVLIPELVCMLIQDDTGGAHSDTYDDALSIQKASRKFGVAMYPSDASDPRTTRSASGSWLGASPRRERKRQKSDTYRGSDGYVQQTLEVRRSARIPLSGPRTMLDVSDSEDESTAPMHQQRLHLGKATTPSKSPAPRPRPRQSTETS